MDFVKLLLSNSTETEDPSKKGEQQFKVQTIFPLRFNRGDGDWWRNYV
jgi:hypothetical protein